MLKLPYIVAYALVGSAVAAVAQTPDGSVPSRHVELWGGVSIIATAPSGVLSSSYSPPLLLDGDFTSRAAQTLALDAARNVGFEVGINWFAAPHVGLQVIANRAAMDITGANGPYALDLTYVSRPPPTSEPQTMAVRQSVPWPGTSGTLTQWTIAVNPVARFGRPDGVTATLSGGLSYYRISGTAQPLGYTTFRLGGHSVLFSDEYHLAVSLEPTDVLGFNAGAEIAVPFSARAALVFGYRYLGGRTTDVAVRLSTILNADQVVNQETTASISARLAPAPARVDVSSSRLLVGVKVR